MMNTLYPFNDLPSKTAVCTLINIDNCFLAVSRKDNPNDFGLPGGKLENNETLIECAIRETLEETGYHVQIDPWNPFIHKDNDFLVITFKASIISKDEKELKSSETGIVRQVKKSTLIKGSFGEYNKQMFKHFGYIK